MKKAVLILILFLTIAFNIFSQSRTYETSRLTDGEALKIDGDFSENAWNKIQWEGDFTQFEPNNGEAPSQQTSFKILYDDDNIYVAIKNYDSEPSKIERRMTRRDGYDGDYCGIHFDSYYDKRTAFVFLVSAAGVKNDGVFTNDGDEYDGSLDPIWYVKTKMHSDGWNAEMKIPLSQLRFGNGEDLTWGMQVLRSLFRKEELSMWRHIPRGIAGWISNYGELKGLKDIEAGRQIEIAPYLLTKLNSYEEEAGNPFADGLDIGFDAGLDVKFGITNDLIMDISINPDFGQVEADPSEVNLTAFESFFEEKRPFFIEGTSITNYQITPGGNPWSSDNLFYSRRVGRSPQYSPSLQEGEYMKFPQNSRILGAIKLTGKTKNGWSIGVIENLVNKEMATISLDGENRKISVEPLSNYLLGRVQKDMDNGNTIMGAMLTATNRFIKEDHLNFLPKSSYTGGLDFTQMFMDKKYFISAKLVGSLLQGSKEAIAEQQLSSRRYFQRPDADYIEFDENKESLSGHGATLMFGKSANSGLRYLFNLTWRSPGLELNDLGYLRRSDNVFHFVWIGYQWLNPFEGVREILINGNEWAGWDFGSTSLFKGINMNTSLQSNNFWRFNFQITKEFSNVDNAELRGGPALHYPGGGDMNIFMGSNSTKKFRLNLDYGRGWGDEDHYTRNSFGGEISFRPSNTLSLMLHSSYNISRHNLQYVGNFNETEVETDYVFSDLNQKIFNVVFRADYNVTPDLTIQFYASPFIGAGLYDEYKKITDPDALEYLNSYHIFEPSRIALLSDNTLGIDKNGDQDYDIYFDNPDFNFKQFRSNLVARWEYIPGSVLYIVWAEGRTDYISDGSFNIVSDVRDLFKVKPNDVFLIKLSHRFSVGSR